MQRLLPRVLETNDIETRFQAVYDVRPWVPVLRGYEAYARFPAAPEVPTGLWFRTAEHMGLGRELSLAAGRTALTTLRRIPRTAVLFVNTFPEAMADLVEAIEPDSPGRVVFDVPAYSFNGCDVTGQVDSVRHAGMGVSFDGEPLDDDTFAHIVACKDHLDFVKIDAIDGTDSVEDIARLADWCHRNGVFLVAKRVESTNHLERLRQAGVDWAQGHALSHDVPI